MKKIILIFILIASLCFTFSCGKDDTSDTDNGQNTPSGDTSDTGDTGGEDGGEQTETVTVKIRLNDTFSIDGDDEVEVEVGGTASFKLVFADNYRYQNCTAGKNGKFADGVLTISNCTEDMTVRVYTATIRDECSVTVVNDDTYGSIVSSVKENKGFEGDTVALIVTPNTDKCFIGWSIGGTFVDGKELVSEELSYDFTLEDDITVYANYLDDKIKLVEYNLSGGTVSNGTGATTYKKFHYTKYKNSPNLVADQGLFVKEGHTLLGFSENPDGSGAFYTAGGVAKVPANGKLTLYAQWSKWSDASLFQTVPTQNGVKIISYSGDEQTLSIPAEINGSSVIALTTGAFVGAPFETLVIPYSVKTVDNGTFRNCSQFDRLYMTDAFTSIYDEAFEGCRKFSRFFLGAHRNPNFIDSAENLAFRFDALYTRDTAKNMIIVVGGSNVMHGFKAELMETQYLRGSYQVLNCGNNVNATGMLFMEAMKGYLVAGDIVVHAPEFGPSSEQFGGIKITDRTYRVAESCFNVFSLVDCSKYEGFLTALTTFNTELKTAEYGSYDKVPKLITLRWCDYAKQTAYELPAETGATSGIGVDKILEEKAAAVNALAADFEASGIKYLFSYAPILEHPDASAEVISGMDEKYKELLDCPVISKLSNYVFPEMFYYDTAYHLSTYGANLRTEKLYNDLKPYLK